jgi:hypothetical protein
MLKKISILIIAICCLLVNSFSVYALSPEELEKTIVRHVIKSIEWDDFNKRIVVHKIVIQKIGEEPLLVYPAERTISGDSFQKETLSDSQAEQFVRENSPEVFKSDIIFGHTVDVFKDLSHDQNISEEEINKWVELAEKQVEKDFQDGPEKFKGLEDPATKKWFLDIYTYIYSLPIFLILILIINKCMRYYKK